MDRKRWSLVGACMFLTLALLPATPSSAATWPATPADGCARSEVEADQAVAPVAYVSADVVVAAPFPPDPEGGPVPEECRPAAEPEVVLEPGTEIDVCAEEAARTRARLRAPGVTLSAVAPVESACADPNLGIPGPLVVNVYWNGTNTGEVEWVYQGSFDCVLLEGYFWRYRIECTPLDVVNFHCVNPGVAATFSGPYYTRAETHLECGNISGNCVTPWGGGACSDYFGGNQQALVVCSGLMNVIVGGGSGEPKSLTGTCYSDPPEIPRRDEVYPGEIPVVESFVRV